MPKGKGKGLRIIKKTPAQIEKERKFKVDLISWDKKAKAAHKKQFGK